jgi:nucleotide-binding universal stress UspA family protein
MFESIYIPVDCSPCSNASIEWGILLAEKENSTLIGSHVYAAKLHDQRFKTMEAGLPHEFQQEQILEKQRTIHADLITKGLELITDSYLEAMEEKCKKAQLNFKGISLEGKNWQELSNDINHKKYDLVIMGTFGTGRVEESIIGSVTERVARRIQQNLLVIRDEQQRNEGNKIVVALDGSERAWGALQLGITLAKEHNKKLEVISAFDPYFHYTVFNSLNKVLTKQARTVFKFEQQEELHENIIDSGLAKIYQSHLDIAHRLAKDAGLVIKTKLLAGKSWQEILKYVRNDPPLILLIGRTGIHNQDEIDLGSNAENLLRSVPCNVMLVAKKDKPPLEYEAAETVVWTKEAEARMAKIPKMVRGMAIKAIQGQALAEGVTMITSEVVDKAVCKLLPTKAIEAMRIKKTKSVKAEESTTFDLLFQCSACDYVHHQTRPEICPVCKNAGEEFRILQVSSQPNHQLPHHTIETTFDGIEMAWSNEAITILKQKKSGVARDQLRLKVEKQARITKQKIITSEMVSKAIQP